MDITWDNGQTTTTQWPNNNRFKGDAQGKTFDQHVLHILQTEEGATEQHKKEIEFQLDKYERMHQFDCDCGCRNVADTEGCRWQIREEAKNKPEQEAEFSSIAKWLPGNYNWGSSNNPKWTHHSDNDYDMLGPNKCNRFCYCWKYDDNKTSYCKCYDKWKSRRITYRVLNILVYFLMCGIVSFSIAQKLSFFDTKQRM